MSDVLLSTDEIRAIIRGYVVDSFLFGDGEVRDEAPLIDEGIFDSLGVLEMVAFVEERFGIEVADPDVVPESFGSVASLADFVVARQAASRAEQASTAGAR